MCSYDDLVSHIEGCRLNDQATRDESDWKVWKKEVIRKTIKEAVAAIYALRPELFAVTKEVTLTACACVQCFGADCSRVVDVIAVNGDSCQHIEEKDDKDDAFSLEFLNCYYTNCQTPNCYGDSNKADGADYKPGWWDQMEPSPCCIRFKNPPPLEGMKATVLCVPNDVLTSDTLPPIVCGELFQAVVDNAIARLYAIDHKDGTSIRLAEFHWAAYQGTMMTKFAVDFSLLEKKSLLTKRRVDE